MGRKIRESNRLAPTSPDGYLYYIRIASQFGPLYKLGFTKSASVERRYLLQVNADSEVQAVFLFAHHANAYYREQQLHRHFAPTNAFGLFAASAFLPLFRNGQSELYPRDILGLDAAYTEEQGRRTIANLPNRLKKPGKFAPANWWSAGLWALLGIGQNGSGHAPAGIAKVPDDAIRVLLAWIQEQAARHGAAATPADAANPSARSEAKDRRANGAATQSRHGRRHPAAADDLGDDTGPAPLADPMLLVGLIGRRSGPHFAALARDIKPALSKAAADPVTHRAMALAWLLAEAGQVVRGHDGDDFYEAIRLTQQTGKQLSSNYQGLHDCSGLVQALLRHYGLHFADEDSWNELIKAAGEEELLVDENGVLLGDTQIVELLDKRAATAPPV